MKRGIIVWIAQGFGVGKIPYGPGTFGSILGLGFFFLLLQFSSLLVVLAGVFAGAVVSVVVSASAEHALGERDPGSVVIDEVVAMPACFAAWLIIIDVQTGGIPLSNYFFNSGRWLYTLGIFAGFRFFDIVKPWPVRQSQ